MKTKCTDCKYRQKYQQEEFNKRLNELFEEFDIKVVDIQWSENYPTYKTIKLGYYSDNVGIYPDLHI